MKKLLYILLLFSYSVYGQNTEASNQILNNIVRNNVLSPARVANALDALNLSKQGFIAELVAGGTDTYTLTANASVTSYATNLSLNVRFTNTNATTSPTLNVNALGAKAIKLSSGAALDAGDISAGGAYILRYDGTEFRMLGPAVGGGGVPQCPVPISTFSSSHTLAGADQCNLIGTIRMDLTNVADVVVPLHSSEPFDDGQTFQLYQVGDSAFTIDPAVGVNVVNLSGGSLTSLGKGSVMVLIQWDEDEWDMISSSAGGGSGTINFASNGNVIVGDTVVWGGPGAILNQATSIDIDDNNFQIAGVADGFAINPIDALMQLVHSNVKSGSIIFGDAPGSGGEGLEITADKLYLGGTGAISAITLNTDINLQANDDVIISPTDDVTISPTDDINLAPAGSLLLSGSAGTSGQVFTSQGSASPPIWTTPSGFTGWPLTGSETLTGDVFMDGGGNNFELTNAANINLTSTAGVHGGNLLIDTSNGIMYTGDVSSSDPIGEVSVANDIAGNTGAAKLAARNASSIESAVFVTSTATNQIIDLSADFIRLNSVAPSSPTTQFLRGDMTWITPNSTTNLVGTNTNSNATAGNLGEEINSAVSTYTNYTTTVTYQNITSITLTAGDWDISALFTYNSNSATITAAANGIFVISTTTASAAGSTEGVNISYVPQAALLGTSKFTDVISPYRVSLSGTTTFYLNTQAAFTLGNPQFVGSLRARRCR